jgi:hypothetical protein
VDSNFYSGPWDLEVATNVIIVERSLSELPQPHPETEAMRATFIAKLRQSYQDLCHSREGNYLRMHKELIVHVLTLI